MTQAMDILSSVVTAHIVSQEENGELVPLTVASLALCIRINIREDNLLCENLIIVGYYL